jgi:hypothetical protein
VTEHDLQVSVIDIAKLHGYRVAHQRPARTNNGWRTAVEGHAGFPDLVLVRGVRNGQPARLLFVELKTAKGRVSDDQKRWLEVLREVPRIEVHIWQSEDLDSGKIAEILNGSGKW